MNARSTGSKNSVFVSGRALTRLGFPLTHSIGQLAKLRPGGTYNGNWLKFPWSRVSSKSKTTQYKRNKPDSQSLPWSGVDFIFSANLANAPSTSCGLADWTRLAAANNRDHACWEYSPSLGQGSTLLITRSKLERMSIGPKCFLAALKSVIATTKARITQTIFIRLRICLIQFTLDSSALASLLI